MSRFNTSKVLVKTAPTALDPGVPIAPPAVSAAPSPVARSPLILDPAPSDVSLMQRVGFGLFCVLMLSGFANEFAMRAFHVKAYVSTVSWVLLPLLLALSGNLLRGLRDITGRLWFLFLAWIVLAVPFSVWKGGSVTLLLNYLPHGWILLFYCSSFLISFRHCRRFLYFVIASNFTLLLDCFLFGAVNDGRFDIPNSIFFTNANDLALQLLIAITQFMYLLYQRQVWKQAAGAIGILIALIYLLRTGSRGAFLATLILVLVCIAIGRNRTRLLIIGVPVAIAALVLVPSSAFHRLSLIALAPETITIGESTDIGAVASQVQRMALFRQSLTYALTHPLFGVGPGQFAVAAFGDAEKTGTRANWLGTHNSYTQVASECGIPAFILYVSVIGIALVSSFRIFRRTSRWAEHADLNAMAFCYFCATLAYAIATFFFHIAYSSYLPGLAGMVLALRLCTSPRLWSSRPQ